MKIQRIFAFLDLKSLINFDRKIQVRNLQLFRRLDFFDKSWKFGTLCESKADNNLTVFVELVRGKMDAAPSRRQMLPKT